MSQLGAPARSELALPILRDAARLEASLLFEATPLPLPLDELAHAPSSAGAVLLRPVFPTGDLGYSGTRGAVGLG